MRYRMYPSIRWEPPRGSARQWLHLWLFGEGQAIDPHDAPVTAFRRPYVVCVSAEGDGVRGDAAQANYASDMSLCL